MQLKRLFEMQKRLDNHIIEERKLEGQNLINKKILAFNVEAAELANEIRFFKFWSSKGPSHPNIIFEEYTDGLHFLLSIGLETRAFHLVEGNFEVNYCCKADLTEEFLHINRLALEFQMVNSYQNYRGLLNRYLSLGRVLGFSQEEIFQGYISKNKINHQRQEQGY